MVIMSLIASSLAGIIAGFMAIMFFGFGAGGALVLYLLCAGIGTMAGVASAIRQDAASTDQGY